MRCPFGRRTDQPSGENRLVVSGGARWSVAERLLHGGLSIKRKPKVLTYANGRAVVNSDWTCAGRTPAEARGYAITCSNSTKRVRCLVF